MPKTELLNTRMFPRFSGLTTFGRVPRIEDIAPENSPADWLIFGAPFDIGVTYRPGSRFGPRAIREESHYLKPYHMVHDIRLTDVFSIADAGDAPVKMYSCEDNANAIADWATDLPESGHTRLMMLGGDHSNTLAALRATYIRSGSPAGGLALVHFDSHLDTVDSVSAERFGHASPFIRAIEEGIVDPSKMVSVGIKGPLNTADDLRYGQENGVRVLTYEQWRSNGPSAFYDAVKSIGSHPAYFTFDIDCIDPTFAPGTGTPSVGGFTSAEVLELIRGLASANPSLMLAGADVVEVLPDRDVAGNTALLAAHIAYEIMCLDAVTRSE